MKAWFLAVLLLLSAAAHSAEIAPFAAPENSYPAMMGFLGSAGNSLHMEVYILSSSDIAAKLAQLEDQGIEVSIILEGGPVGGIAGYMPVLCALQDSGADIMLYKGPFRYIHAKYIVADRSAALVSTENFGSSAFSPDGKGNRGYGMIIHDESIAEQLLDIFNADLQDSEMLECRGVERAQLPPAYSSPAPLEKINAENIELVATPLDKAGIDRIKSLLDGSSGYVYIEQQYIQPWSSGVNPWMEASLGAARNGAKLRVLLDGSWYSVQEDDPDSNLVAAGYVNSIAEKEGIDASAKVYDGPHEKIHAKAVFSENYAFISSINWNENSPKNNREIGIIAYGSAAPDYYKAYFEPDFEGKASVKTPEFQLPGIEGLVSAGNSVIVFFIAVIIGISLLLLRKKKKR